MKPQKHKDRPKATAEQVDRARERLIEQWNKTKHTMKKEKFTAAQVTHVFNFINWQFRHEPSKYRVEIHEAFLNYLNEHEL